MSDDEATATTPTTPTVTFTPNTSEKIQSALHSLTTIVNPTLSVTSSTTPLSILNECEIYSQIAALLRQPNSGAGDNNLCRWLYDTFQSNVADLQLTVLRFLPIIAGVYLSRVAERKPQAGFEAVLLALYAHETTSRAGEPVTVTIPDMSHPSVYHESKATINKNNATDKTIVVLSPLLEPHGTVRSTRRARIVGVAFELFYSKISQMSIAPKIDFCKFCKIWAGQNGDMYKYFEDEDDEEDDEEAEVKIEKDKESEEFKKGRVPMPWELLQPILRILGHCLMGPNNKDTKLFEVASEACRCLFARAMHDVNPNAILPMRSLLRLSKNIDEFDATEPPKTDVISL
ncbi:uncharacterized protein LOC123924157 [Trifolium pratense]|uniref:uncharacterized protein LOC123924157 n=1 Tax=Trifolium pratense TaxID=57577 RepID=UPI001E69667C|nr:uncharacterized protein LOC123924157 [Trifolium pratense]